jgi:hypothetical protein
MYRSLAQLDTTHDAVARRWLHMFPADLAPTLLVTLTPYSVWGDGASAEHGSPHDYDADVPIVFAGPFFRAGKYTAPVRVTDMAPTIAAVLGVRPTERLDGRVLREALPATSTTAALGGPARSAPPSSVAAAPPR